jgi:hypothetical protein
MRRKRRNHSPAFRRRWCLWGYRSSRRWSLFSVSLSAGLFRMQGSNMSTWASDGDSHGQKIRELMSKCGVMEYPGTSSAATFRCQDTPARRQAESVRNLLYTAL